MQTYEIVALIVSAVGVACFAVIFTILYRNYAQTSALEIESGQRDVELIERVICENFKRSRKWHKIYQKTKQVLAVTLIAIMVPFLVLSVISKIQNGVVMLFNKGVIAVASGSMSEKHKDNTYLENLDNQFQTYDLIVLEKLDSEIELKKYDVIAYVNDEGINIIHRIIGIEYTANGIRYVTRGDSNNATDKYKPSFDDIIGRYTDQRVALIGLFAMFLQSYSGIITIVAVIYCLLMIEGIGEKINRTENARLTMLSQSIDFEREKVLSENELESTFIEKVRYKNYEYIFDENGFVSKTEIVPLDKAPRKE
jgi:signal peptidase I